jgi:hypothetical protein
MVQLLYSYPEAIMSIHSIRSDSSVAWLLFPDDYCLLHVAVIIHSAPSVQQHCQLHTVKKTLKQKIMLLERGADST